MPHFCCASKVKVYWSLALPWSLVNHEALRTGFAYDQQIACRRLERFGYEDIQHYYCYAQETQGSERLPLARICLEVDGDDFQVRKDIHAERAVNLSCALGGVPVTFHPYWDMLYVTQTTKAQTSHLIDGTTDTNISIEPSYCERSGLFGTEPRGYEGLTRHRTLISDGDPRHYGHTTEMRFGRDVHSMMLWILRGKSSCAGASLLMIEAWFWLRCICQIIVLLFRFVRKIPQTKFRREFIRSTRIYSVLEAGWLR